MRLDKFLKLSRIIKRRTVANEICSKGRVSVNGSPAKSSYNVKLGDIIEIAFGTGKLKLKVKDVREIVKKNEAEELYTVLKD